MANPDPAKPRAPENGAPETAKKKKNAQRKGPSNAPHPLNIKNHKHKGRKANGGRENRKRKAFCLLSLHNAGRASDASLRHAADGWHYQTMTKTSLTSALTEMMTPAGLEPAIPGSVGRCLIHWATGPCILQIDFDPTQTMQHG